MVQAEMNVFVETQAGASAGYQDKEYEVAGAKIEKEISSLLDGAEIIPKVHKPIFNPRTSKHELDKMPEGATLIVSSLFLQADPEIQEKLQKKRFTAFSLDLLPRIARAQNMDVLSSMANIAGYKSVILAANYLQKFFPMLMTAAGTVTPARVLVIGAGVAGLQAIATARRLGAIVRASDVRPQVKEQVESLGAQFAELDLKHEEVEDSKGYAKEVSKDTVEKERELIRQELRNADICITTAQVPRKKAPVLITEDMVKEMKMGSVIVDLAAEQGGNCELTEPDKEVNRYGVKILGFLNIVSTMAFHASQLYSRNMLNFLFHISDKSQLKFDLNDEITRSTLVLYKGEVYSSGETMKAIPASS